MREILADADELELPVESMLVDVAEKAFEFATSGHARQPKGDDHASRLPVCLRVFPVHVWQNIKSACGLSIGHCLK